MLKYKQIRNWAGFLIIMLLVAIPITTAAVSFVPCGNDPGDRCTFGDLVTMIVRVINYLMAFAGVVAIYYVLTAGFWLMVSLGNPERVERGKVGLSSAVVGFAIVALSFVFVNLLLNGIFARDSGTRPWYSLVFRILLTHPDALWATSVNPVRPFSLG